MYRSLNCQTVILSRNCYQQQEAEHYHPTVIFSSCLLSGDYLLPQRVTFTLTYIQHHRLFLLIYIQTLYNWNHIVCILLDLYFVQHVSEIHSYDCMQLYFIHSHGFCGTLLCEYHFTIAVYSGCFQYLTIMNSTAIYILMPLFFSYYVGGEFVVICESEVLQLFQIFSNIKAYLLCQGLCVSSFPFIYMVMVQVLFLEHYLLDVLMPLHLAKKGGKGVSGRGTAHRMIQSYLYFITSINILIVIQGGIQKFI